MRDFGTEPQGSDDLNSDAVPREAGDVPKVADDQVDSASPVEQPVDSDWEEWQDRYLRLAAEFENHKKRTARDWQERVQTGHAELLLDLLGVVDNFERALAALDLQSPSARGVTLIYDQVMGLLSRRGVLALPAQGEKFDPEVHEAIMHSPSEEVPAGFVCQELRRGYRYHGRVFRPAQVAVSSGPVENREAGDAASPDDSKGIESGAEHE